MNLSRKGMGENDFLLENKSVIHARGEVLNLILAMGM